MDEFDVVVVGAGVSGLATATELALRGLSVLCADRKTDLSVGVHTSGIFPRRTLESFPLPEDCLGSPIRRVILHSPRGRSFELRSPRTEFRLGHMERLYRFMLDKALKAGVEWAPGHLFQGLEFLRSSLVVEFRSEGFPRLVRSRFVIGADGASSGVARSLRLDRNEHLLVGSEEVYREARLGSEPSLHCFIDPILAPGYLGWLVAAGDEIRLGVAGHAGGFSPQQSLDVIKERARRACALDGVEEAFASGPLERRSGLIPVGGMLRRIAHHRGLLVGDAAGAPSPLTAGGLDPCLRRAPWVAEVVTGYLREGRENGLLAYSGASLRRRFLAKRLMRLGYSRLSSPLLAEVGLFALRAPLVNLAARAVFFGDVAPKWATSAFARVEAALPLALPDAGPSDGREGGERGEGGDQHE